MKRIVLATLLALGPAVAAAQATPAAAPAAVPALNCGPVPEYPGRLGSDNQKRTFDKAYRVYDKCVRQYVEDRKAAIQANEDAAKTAVDNFNALVLKMRADSGEDVTTKAPGDSAPAPAPSTGSGKKAY